jgi:cytochrome c oxidase accessory protein FixG
MTLLPAQEQVLSTLNPDGSRRRIYPRPARGRFYRWRQGVAYGLIALFVLIPHLSAHGKPLILLDLARREFAFFGTTFLPTDTVLLMLLGLAIVIAVVLLTALFGRVWCGWACPQTVYMEWLYRPIERLFEGSPAQQRRLDRSRLNVRRLGKYAAFLLLSMFVAHTFLAYFVGVEQLAQWVRQSPLERPAPFLVMVSVTGLMFFDFAWFREQTCILACPYGRLQSVLLDRQSLIIGYDAGRGEPRGKPTKPGAAELGDCIDCRACVTTCPTGIDIRAGLQMECIGCAQCVDACDAIMDRLGRARGLIRYSSQDELTGARRQLLRPRVVIYPAIFAIVVGLFVMALGSRPTADVTVLRVAGAPFQLLSGELVSNQVRLRIVNRGRTERSYTVEVVEAADVRLIAPQNPVAVAPGRPAQLTFFVAAPRATIVGGERLVRVRVVDGAGFVWSHEHRLLGPSGGIDAR